MLMLSADEQKSIHLMEILFDLSSHEKNRKLMILHTTATCWLAMIIWLPLEEDSELYHRPRMYNPYPWPYNQLDQSIL